MKKQQPTSTSHKISGYNFELQVRGRPTCPIAFAKLHLMCLNTLKRLINGVCFIDQPSRTVCFPSYSY